MNHNNPSEFIFCVGLILLSIFIMERIIANAFKTVVVACIIFFVFAFFGTKNHERIKNTPQFRFSVKELLK